MVVFKCSSAVEQVIKWDHNLYTLHSDCNEAIDKLEESMKYYIQQILAYTKAKEYKVIMMFSDRENFRKTLLPTYKSDRKDKRKPICYNGVVEYVEQNYEFMRVPGLEADDLLSINAGLMDNVCVVSGDKDILQIQGLIYNHLTDTFTKVSAEESLYQHYFQCLVGDKVDSYDGVPGVGKVTAEKLLAASCTWDTVVAAYEKKGISYEDMMVQCRVAKILTKDNWSDDTGVILWNPYVQS